jgi:type I restriction enzyme S subunit
MRGSTGRQRVPFTVFRRELDIALPPLSEQRKIATVLYTVDRAIEKTEDIIQQTKNVRDGLRQSAFEYGIDENGEFRDLNNGMRKETRIGEIPQTWEFLRLDEVCSDVVDCINTTPEYSDSGIRVILTSEIKDGRYNPESSPFVTEEVYEERIRRIEPQPGDVIFTREAPIGEAFKIPEGERLCLGQRTIQLRAKNGSLDSNFLLELLYSEKMQSWFQRVAVGSTTKHMRVGDVEGMKIPVPRIMEQKRIASLLGRHRDYIETNMRYADQLKQHKRGLMQDLLSGTVRMTDTNIQVPDKIAQYG